MFKKNNFLMLMALLGFTASNAQVEDISPEATADEVVRKKDTDQHGKWKQGDYRFPGKPKNMWQVGLHGGGAVIHGDVTPQFGWGAGLYARKALGYSSSIRLDAGYYNNYGLSFEARTTNRDPLDPNRGYDTIVNQLGYNQYFYDHKTEAFQASVDFLFNMGNLLFHKRKNRWSINLGLGVGLYGFKTTLNALNANGNRYTYSNVPNLLTNPTASQIRDGIRQESDDTYETAAMVKKQFSFMLGDYKVNPTLKPSVSLEYRLSKRITIGVEGNWFMQWSEDLLDGDQWTEQGSFTPAGDMPGYYHLRLGFNLGSGSKRVEPLWFVNPMDGAMGQIADTKKTVDELKGMMDDDDNDGVPNRLDKEPNTPADCPVDVRGKQLDSDEDGVPDCLDKEKFSPPGYPVDPNGVAQVPAVATKAQLDDLANKMLSKDDPRVKDLLSGTGSKGANLGDWWLPMIHFDLDKYKIKPQFYEELHHVASVMQKFPNVKVVAKGHTDNRNTNQYNMVLSWNRANEAINYLVTKYGIPRERFVLNYDGEEKEMVVKPGNEPGHYMNRRVEFHVAKDEKDMARPAGPNAGSK